jgi:hypothetical protein
MEGSRRCTKIEKFSFKEKIEKFFAELVIFCKNQGI